MAISRAQLLKELLPGLNALFGLEYAKYGEETAEIFETESQMQSVDNNLMRESDPRMPMFNNRKTKVTFGNGT